MVIIWKKVGVRKAVIVSRKEKMTTDELLEHMKSKGIAFEICDEPSAKKYLRTKNDYFRVTAFRKLFQKHEGGERDGRYIDLDFGYLQQLSYVDQSLRSLLRMMSLDVEHYQKVMILDRITEDANEDGYSIVVDYKKNLPEKSLDYLKNEIEARKNDIYCGDIIKSYKDEMPVWAFFEVTSFGTFVNFCKFCSQRWGDERLLDIHYMLKKAKSLRNAASHGACIMNGFAEDGNRCDDLPKQIQNSEMWLKLSKSKRRRWKGNPRMREIITLFYLFSISVGEGEAKNKCRNELKSFYGNAQSRLCSIPKNNHAVAGVDFIDSLTEALELR